MGDVVSVVFRSGAKIAPCGPKRANNFRGTTKDKRVRCCQLFSNIKVVLLQLRVRACARVHARVNVVRVGFYVGNHFRADFSVHSDILLGPKSVTIDYCSKQRKAHSRSQFPLNYCRKLYLRISPTTTRG